MSTFDGFMADQLQEAKKEIARLSAELAAARDEFIKCANELAAERANNDVNRSKVVSLILERDAERQRAEGLADRLRDLGVTP